MAKKKADQGTSEYVLVDLHWSIGLNGFGYYGPGKDVRVPREFARQLGLEVKGEAENPEEERLAKLAEETGEDADALRERERRGPDPDQMTPRMRKEVRERAEAEAANRGVPSASGGKKGAAQGEGGGEKKGGDQGEDLDALTVDVLKERYDAGVADGSVQAVDGTGANGAHVKADYVKALSK